MHCADMVRLKKRYVPQDYNVPRKLNRFPRIFHFDDITRIRFSSYRDGDGVYSLIYPERGRAIAI